MDGFRASLTEGQLDAYLKAIAGLDTLALKAGVDRFIKREVPWFDFDYGRPPTAPDLVREVSLHHRNLHREDNILKLRAPEHGMIDADYGAGTVRLADLTWAEVQIVEKQKGRTSDGRSMAGMTAEQIRESINQPKLPMAAPVAKLQKMGS